MRREDREEFRRSIVEEIALWAPQARRTRDRWWAAIERTPAYFDSLFCLLDRPELDDAQRRVVHRVIKYLVSPLDLMPEFIYGAPGFREDLYFIALAAQRLGEELGPGVLTACGLGTDDAGLALARRLGEAAEDKGGLPEDMRRHLALLLEADAVAGDEELGQPGAQLVPGQERRLLPSEPHTIVFAGPGTGKTHRLELELERLLVEDRVPPGQILVTTFTNKAADELRVRVRERLLAHADTLDVEPALRQLTISTIHAFCFQLIRDFHHHALFLKGLYEPLDETRRMLFLFRHGIGALQLQPIYSDWRKGLAAAGQRYNNDLFQFYAYVGGIYDFLSEDVMVGAEPELRAHYLELIPAGRVATTPDERIIATYPRYWQLVQDEGFIDQSMVLAYAEALLKDPQVRKHVQGSYRHVLVDEYQDTNPIQDRIFHDLIGHSGRLFAVADDDQSIYAFRGADVRNATGFTERWPGAKVELLEENRRSSHRLVEASQALIGHNRVRHPKYLYTQNPPGEPPWRLEADADALPGAVADLLTRLKAAGLVERWDEVALLFRGLSRRVANYCTALEAHRIPFALGGDRHFLGRPMVHGLLGVLEMLAGEADAITSRKRVHKPFFEAMGQRDPQAMLEAVRRWHGEVQAGQHESLLGLFYAIVNDVALDGPPALLPDLGHLSGFIAEAEAQLTSPDLVKRLGYFNRYARAAADSFTGPAAPQAHAVRILTMHKAKGLEFPMVVVADAVEGSLPAHFPPNTRSRLRQELAGLSDALDPLEEERRVLYVAMTRAERYLVLATTPGSPSPFLAEFPSVPVPAPLPARRVPRTYPHRRRSEPPLHATHGEVYDYHFCPRRYLLQDVHRFATQVIAPTRAGQSLHRSLEVFHRLLRDGERITPDRLQRIFQRAWVPPRGKKEAEREHEHLFGVFERYARPWQEAKRGHQRVLQVEQPFYVAQQPGVLAGKIDLLRERDGAPELVEFKFHLNPMLKDYPQKQLEHYSLAFPHDSPRLFVHYLENDIEEEVHVPDAGHVRSELTDVFERIRERTFNAAPEARRCRLCPVRQACCERKRAA